ncbi:apolipoprotein N-acyltransferase [Demetria terragena]|uniref:apolipoprotein N-acyltransferase n=1 Tax=Demetria terragena TaxID=63959 RepID=UPI00036440C3|nr:apolipoprotein N-acyltransferase [Demetria terragena]
MVIRLLLAVAAGLALWLAQPGYDWWPLAFVGIALFALVTASLPEGHQKRRGFVLGMVMGLATFIPTLSWSGIYVGAFPWFALATASAVYIGFLGMALAVLQRGGVRVFVGAAAWVAMEAVRSSVPFGGFPWARVAFSQTDGPLVHLASLAGAPGVTYAVAVIAGAVALLGQYLLARRDAAPAVRLRTVTMAVAAAALMLLISIPWPTPTDGEALTVAGIQGNVPQAGLEFNAQRRAVLNNHLALTRSVARRVKTGALPQPEVVLWPENSSDIDPTRDPSAGLAIESAVEAVGVPTLVGAVLQEPSPNVSNTSLLYQPGQGITDRYVKQRPAPFAEYIPYRSFFRFFSDKVDLVTADFAAGDTVGLMEVPTSKGTVRIAPIICFEVAYDDLTRDPVKGGAQLLVVQTNNATFGYSDESVQQLAISRLRAIEHGRSIVHVSTVGESALITPDGATHQQSELFTAKAMVGDVPLRTATTLATRVGRIPELGWCAVAAIAIVLAWNRERGRRAGTVPTQDRDLARPQTHDSKDDNDDA